MKKISIYMIIMTFIFQIIHVPVYAETTIEQVNGTKANVIIENDSEKALLFEEESEDSEQLAELENDVEVTVLEKFEEFSFVEYVDVESNITYQGYLSNKFITLNELSDNSEENASQNQEKNIQNYDNDNLQNNEEDADENNIDEEDSTLDEPEEEREEEVEAEENDEEQKEAKQSKNFISPSSIKLSKSDSPSIYGNALKSPTYVYESQSRDSKKLKSYEQGTVLKYKALNVNWYEATVKYNGEWVTGYIHVNDVGISPEEQQTLYGPADKSPTYVYELQSRNSKKLKSYEQGTILKYKTLNDNWYEATVKYNGEWVIGYIHVSDVGTLPEEQKTLNGLADKSPTYVYESQSRDSKKLKSYKKGSILKYKTLKNNWYEATIKYNGEWVTGYIHVSDVENFPETQTTLNGIALKNPTKIYQSPTKNKVLKSYKKGSILKYQSLTEEWYEATVKYNGEWVTGYIHKNDVDTFPDTQTTLYGIASKNPTKVYQSPTKDKTLKSYSQGSILKYQSLTTEWYEATIKYNGKWVTGYIHVNDVEETFDTQENLRGAASKSPTKVYSKATRNSSVLKSYSKGSGLIFKTFSPNWFEAKVYINGKPKKGYIHVADVTFDDVETETSYNLTLEEALNIQLTASPQTDNEYDTYVSKSYIDKNDKVTADVLNVRGGPSTNYWVVGQLKKGDKVKILGEKGNWYKIEYTRNHQWVNASPEDILYYLDPNNFINDSKQKYQFLDLSKPSGAPASVLNNYLSGKGILSGQGQAFIDSGVQNGINDVYLISHALLETGNGTSQLARGVEYNGVTVYNMFGVNAYDSCPIECGAKKAYEEGWTTPYKAIVGGAKFIDTYINRGQNTLYKMRWNPEAMEETGTFGKQYATDIGWASKQVNTMYNLYQSLDSYILNLDIPVYKK